MSCYTFACTPSNVRQHSYKRKRKPMRMTNIRAFPNAGTTANAGAGDGFMSVFAATSGRAESYLSLKWMTAYLRIMARKYFTRNVRIRRARCCYITSTYCDRDVDWYFRMALLCTFVCHTRTCGSSGHNSSRQCVSKRCQCLAHETASLIRFYWKALWRLKYSAALLLY